VSFAPHHDFLDQDNAGTSMNGNEDDLWWEDNLSECATKSGRDDDSKLDDCCMIDKTLCMILLHGIQQENENSDSSVAAVLDQNAEDEHRS
jgi:hypothetical protein